MLPDYQTAVTLSEALIHFCNSQKCDKDFCDCCSARKEYDGLFDDMALKGSEEYKQRVRDFLARMNGVSIYEN